MNEEIDSNTAISEIQKLIMGTKWLDATVSSGVAPNVKLASKAKDLETISADMWAQINKDNDISLPTNRMKTLPSEFVRWADANKGSLGLGEDIIPVPAKGTPEYAQAERVKLLGTRTPTKDTAGNLVPESFIQLTGVKDSNTRANIIEYASRARESDVVYVVDNPEVTAVTRLAGKNVHPEKNLVVVANLDGNWRPIGWIPDAENIRVNQMAKREKIATTLGKSVELPNVELNKDALHDNMEQNGIKVRPAKVAFSTEMAQESGEPAILIKFDKDLDAQAVLRSKNVVSKESVAIDKIMQMMGTRKEAPKQTAGAATAEVVAEATKPKKNTNTINPKREIRESIATASPEEKQRRIFELDSKMALANTNGRTPAPSPAPKVERTAVGKRTAEAVTPNAPVEGKSPQRELPFVKEETNQKILKKEAAATPTEDTVETKRPSLLVEKPKEPEARPPSEPPLKLTVEEKFDNELSSATNANNAGVKPIVSRSAAKAKRKLVETPASILDIPAEELNTAKKWSDTNNGILKKPYEFITKLQQEAYRSGDFEKGNRLQEDKLKFTTENMRAKAKSTLADQGGDADAAFNKFKNDLNSYAVKVGGKEIVTSHEDSQNLRYNFNRWTEELPVKKIKFTDGKIEIVPSEPAVYSRGDRNIEKFNKESGTKLEVFSIDGDSKYEGLWGTVSKVNALEKSMRSNGIVPFGAKVNDMNSMVAVKFDKKLVDIFNKDPKRITDVDPKTLSDEEKFLKVLFHDAIGLPRDIKVDEVAKRWAQIFSREVVDKSPVHTVRKFVLPSPTIAETEKMFGSQILDRSLLGEGADAVGKKSLFDGVGYKTAENAQQVEQYNGFPDNTDNFKDTTFYTYKENGENKAWLEKRHASKLTPESQALLEDLYGIKLKPGDEVTFFDNVKIGKNLGEDISTILGPGKIMEVPSDSMSYKRGELSPGSRWSLSTTGRFGASDGVNKAFVEAYRPAIDKYIQMVNEASASPNEIGPIFKKFKKEFGVDLEENLYGVKKEMLRLGAGKKYLKREIEEAMINAFQQSAMDLGTTVRTGHAFAKPDWGYMKEGKRTFLQPNEIMISADAANKYNISEGDYLMTWRNPVSRKTALSKAKVLIGENHGVNSIGKEQIIASQHDLIVRKEGDYDGDHVNFAVIGENGMSESIANVVEAKRAADLDIVLPPLGKFGERPLTTKNVDDIMSNQFLGVDGVNDAATKNRVIATMVDNGWKAVVGPNKSSGKRPYKVYKGSRLIEQGELPSGSNKNDLTVSFDWKPGQEYLTSRILQESVDAIKSPDLANRGYNDLYLLRRLLKLDGPDAQKMSTPEKISDIYTVNAVEDNAIVNLARKFMVQQQAMFQLGTPGSIGKPRTMAELVEKINDINKKTAEAEEGGSQISPVQDVYKQLQDKIKWENVETNDERVRIWAKTMAGMKEAMPELEAMKTSPKVADFMAKMKKANAEYNPMRKDLTKTEYKELRAEIRNDVINYFLDNQTKYTPEEIDAIAFAVASEKVGNITTRPGDIFLYDEVLAKSPKVARKFFELFEN